MNKTLIESVNKKTPLADECARRKVAFISGATSGIGEAFAHHFARLDYDLILTGRRQVIIEDVANALRTIYQVNVQVIIADFSNQQDIAVLLSIIERNPHVEVLVNNAGYGFNAHFFDDSVDNQLRMLRVHVTVPVMLIHKVLPIMIRNRKGFIINVSSMSAYTPTHTNTMYTSTKVFMTNFAESLHLDVGKFGIKVQCLCPGLTYSDFHRNLSNDRLPRWMNMVKPMKASDVVKCSTKNLRKNNVVCIAGFRNKVIIRLISFLPRNLYYRLVGVAS